MQLPYYLWATIYLAALPVVLATPTPNTIVNVANSDSAGQRGSCPHQMASCLQPVVIAWLSRGQPMARASPARRQLVASSDDKSHLLLYQFFVHLKPRSATLKHA
ncbi:hypothetical protein PENSPDRAFT_688092 [Peniophora sp. CONT]|nr:hypothetical protein PENSPDRAFT_688092 [Peniophora sp. CONT]